MTEKTVDMHIYNETDRVIKSGEKDLNIYKKQLSYCFFPNVYEQFYDRSSHVLLHKRISKEITAVKKDIQHQILLLLQPDEVNDSSVKQLEQNIDSIKVYRTLEMSLHEMESKILTHQITNYVHILKEKGTMLDMIGYIEKLEYDKAYGKFSGILFDNLSVYINSIKRSFDLRYTKGAYDKVEQFRQTYIEQNNENPKISSYDHVFHKDEYLSFMHALKLAMKKNDFYAPDIDSFSVMKHEAIDASKLKKIEKYKKSDLSIT